MIGEFFRIQFSRMTRKCRYSVGKCNRVEPVTADQLIQVDKVAEQARLLNNIMPVGRWMTLISENGAVK